MSNAAGNDGGTGTGARPLCEVPDDGRGPVYEDKGEGLYGEKRLDETAPQEEATTQEESARPAGPRILTEDR